MTEYEFIKAELAKEECFPSDAGIQAVLSYSNHNFEDWLADLIWELHFEWFELSNEKIIA